MSDFTRIASAPGDLLPEAVARRYDALREQFRHDNTIVPLIPQAGEAVDVSATAGSAVAIAAAELYYTTDGALPDERSARVDMRRDAEPGFAPFGGPLSVWHGTIPGQPAGTRVRYRILGRDAAGRMIAAQDGQGFWFRYPVEQSVSTFAYRVGVDSHGPRWLREAVIYQVFLDRFRGDDGQLSSTDLQAKHGGTLRGVTDSLDYLEQLGITCIWLSPIGPAPSYHNYDATDYFSVDPSFGSVEDARELARRAHARGIRLILDFVPSHFSRYHEAFQSATSDPASPFRDWFVFYEWPHRYRSFLEAVPNLVSLNTDSAGVREFLVKSARFWIDVGFDGLRLDHVIGHGMDFWTEFQEALEAVKPDVATIGEATDTPDALRRFGGKVNAILDFPFARALRLAFGTREWTMSALFEFLRLSDAYLGRHVGRVSFLDNHDMDRFLHIAAGDTDSLRLAALVLYTHAPSPVLYYGTEIGMSHDTPIANRVAGGDALARQDMIWDEARWDASLLRFFRDLGQFRNAYAHAIHPAHHLRFVDDGRGCCVYSLGEGMLVCINSSETVVDLDLSASDVVLTTGRRPASLEPLSIPSRTGLVVNEKPGAPH